MVVLGGGVENDIICNKVHMPSYWLFSTMPSLPFHGNRMETLYTS